MVPDGKDLRNDLNGMMTGVNIMYGVLMLPYQWQFILIKSASLVPPNVLPPRICM